MRPEDPTRVAHQIRQVIRLLDTEIARITTETVAARTEEGESYAGGNRRRRPICYDQTYESSPDGGLMRVLFDSRARFRMCGRGV